MRWTMSTLLALALAAPVAAGAGEPGRGHGPGFGPGFGPGALFDPEMLEERIERHAERLADALELTDAQRAAFDELREEGIGTAKTKLGEMRELGERLQALLDSASPDAAAVGAKVIALHELRQELRATRESFESEFAKLLTDEQKFAWDALRETRPGFGEDGPRGFGMRRHGPPPIED